MQETHPQGKFTIYTVLPYALPALVVISYIYFVTRPAVNTISGRIGRGFIHFLVFVVIVWFLYAYDVSRRMDEADTENTEVVPDTFIPDMIERVKGRHWHTDHPDLYADSMGYKAFAFVFLPKHPEIMAVFKDFDFARRYDEGSYAQCVVLMERFLQRYYKLIVTDDEDWVVIGQMYSMLKDIRRELLNTMHSLSINVPIHFKRPILKNKQPTSLYMRKCLRKLQAFTYDKMLVASKKVNLDGRNLYDRRHKPPYTPNEFADEHNVYA